ncbi:MAG: hypothetical protein QM756_27450 [Polyangiaceae bacterium]
MASVSQSFITRWDLDKTYLRSRFDTLSDLVSSALEKIEQKRTVPGATAVLRELGKSGGRVHILSGSPRQMKGKLSAKLRLDGVDWDELTLKPNLSNLLRMRLYALRDQLGYKLPELLDARVRDEQRFGSGLKLREVLVGDDSESDAFVYSLYADLIFGQAADARARARLASRQLAAVDDRALPPSAVAAIARRRHRLHPDSPGRPDAAQLVRPLRRSAGAVLQLHASCLRAARSRLFERTEHARDRRRVHELAWVFERHHRA